MTISKVIENDLCIGCGACKASLGDNVKISFINNGFYEAKLKNKQHVQEKETSALCPFSNSIEDSYGKRLYGSLSHDKRIGYFDSIFVGAVNNHSDRLKSSSGGLTSWFASKLLQENLVDAVIHVGKSYEQLFNYKVSKTVNELLAPENKKSRYYPVTFEHLIDYIVNTNDRLLFIGVPCYVNAIRRIQHELALENIKFVFSLVCGHMKSSGFAESLSWQQGVNPNKLFNIDFRVKKEGLEASDYFVQVESNKSLKKESRNNELFGSNWGHGFFKHKACDFCDDLGGELADLTLGDAWLQPFIKDYRGHNIVISRQKIFNEIIKKHNKELLIYSATVDDFYYSQEGNYRHRRDGLPFRINNSKGWIPKKRTYLSLPVENKKRRILYVFRQIISKKSISAFKLAKKLKTFTLFKIIMSFYIIGHNFLSLGLKTFLRKLFRK